MAFSRRQISLAQHHLHAARDRLLRHHPQTQFIAAHLANDGEDLVETARLLDQHPNVMVKLHRGSASWVANLTRHVTFSLSIKTESYLAPMDPGLNCVISLTGGSSKHAMSIFHTLEAASASGDLADLQSTFPDAVLTKIYYENASRIIPGIAERLAKWHALHP